MLAALQNAEATLGLGLSQAAGGWGPHEAHEAFQLSAPRLISLSTARKVHESILTI